MEHTHERFWILRRGYKGIIGTVAILSVLLEKSKCVNYPALTDGACPSKGRSGG